MKRSKHSLSHYNLLTGNMGQLIPAGNYEVLPGDTIQHRTSALIRLAPQSAPVMHPVTARFHTFFTPYRIIMGPEYEDSGTWEDFITGGKDGLDSQTQPKITLSWATEEEHTGSMADYLGIPFPDENVEITVSALPFRAAARIWNEYYMDQDIQTEIGTTVADIKAFAENPPYRVAWSKDYFSTSRPFTQKGPTVTLPLGGPITGTGAPTLVAGGTTVPSSTIAIESGDKNIYAQNSAIAGTGAAEWGDPALSFDGGELEINDFRRAFALQRLAEARARYGSRYSEYLQYLGVTPQDSRLNRPEYLSGAKQTVQFSEILQTAGVPTGDPGDITGYGVGDMYGHGMAAVRSKRARRFIPEHGHVITFMSVIPRPMYMNGVARHWLYEDKEDYFQKELHAIGQQEVYQGEIYLDGTNDKETFGFQDRNAHYKSIQSRVHGEFRNTLNYWHMARNFNVPPALNPTFIECKPTDRVFNVEDGHKLWCMVNHSIQSRRMVPKSSASRIL